MGDRARSVEGWVLEERLGSGGFGEVWRARRPQANLARALKLVRSDEDSLAAWRHEIDQLEALSHPNVVRFYDAEIVTEYGPYQDHALIVTELCERSLAEELSQRHRGVLTEAECEQLLDDMLAALAAAHSAGIVHRDVKPANILRHLSGSWKLGDFGAARLVPEDASRLQTRVLGTVAYMSAAAHEGFQDAAADRYALGVTVHEALCGERLHPRRPGMTESEYIKLVMDSPPVMFAGLPGPWQTVVRALIGEQGDLSSDEMRRWFRSTRGHTPPDGRQIASDRAPGPGVGLGPSQEHTSFTATAGTMPVPRPSPNTQPPPAQQPPPVQQTPPPQQTWTYPSGHAPPTSQPFTSQQPWPNASGHAPPASQPFPTQQPPVGPPGPGYGYWEPRKAHPKGATTLILGILGLACCSLLAPGAWIIGHNARTEIRLNPGAYTNSGQVTAGWILGIVGTGLLGLWVFYLLLWALSG